MVWILVGFSLVVLVSGLCVFVMLLEYRCV